MDIGLILGLLKVAIETFHDERRDRFRNERDKLEKEWNDEMALPDSERSDLTLDRCVLDCDALARRIIEQTLSDAGK